MPQGRTGISCTRVPDTRVSWRHRNYVYTCTYRGTATALRAGRSSLYALTKAPCRRRHTGIRVRQRAPGHWRCMIRVTGNFCTRDGWRLGTWRRRRSFLYGCGCQAPQATGTPRGAGIPAAQAIAPEFRVHSGPDTDGVHRIPVNLTKGHP